jgi:hypothetical protein
VRTIVEHLLKLEHFPASEPKRGWRETIRTQRADLDENLSAALRPRIEAGLPRAYAKARRDAAAALRDYGEPTADALPERVLTPSTGSSATGCHSGASVSAQILLLGAGWMRNQCQKRAAQTTVFRRSPGSPRP